jgi:protein TonB
MENRRDHRIAELPVNTIGKIIKHQGFDVSTILNDLPGLYESSIPAWSKDETPQDGHKAHPNIKAYHHYVNKFSDPDGQKYYIRFTVQEMKARQGKGKGKGKSLVHSSFVSEAALYEENAPSRWGRVIDPVMGVQRVVLDKKLQAFFDSVKPCFSDSETCLPTSFTGSPERGITRRRAEPSLAPRNASARHTGVRAVNVDSPMFLLRDAFSSRIAVPDRHTLIRAAALAAVVHLWLLFGISLNPPPSSIGGTREITVEIAPALASRAARNAPGNSPAAVASAVDNPADTAPPDTAPPEQTRDTAAPEQTRDTAAPEQTREFAASTEIAPPAAAPPENTPHTSFLNKALPAAAMNPSRERPAERGARPRNPERPSAAPRNNAAALRNNAAGATAERETAPGAALNGVSADENPQTVYNPAPRYPEQARRRGREGTVLVEADVDERGIPAAVRVLRSSGFGILDDAAAEAVGKWRFRPARSAGKTVPRHIVVPIEFRLKKF